MSSEAARPKLLIACLFEKCYTLQIEHVQRILQRASAEATELVCESIRQGECLTSCMISFPGMNGR